MASTLIQILIPLIAAALIGAAFMYWWMKRRYEDVTVYYDEMQSRSRSGASVDALTKADLDDRFASLSSSVASIPAPDLDPLDRRLSDIESAVAGFSVPETDLTPVYERMTRIDQRLAQPDQGIGRVESRLAQLEESVGDVSRRVSALHNADLDPLQSRFSQLEESLRAMDGTAPEVDLGPIHSGLAQLELSLAEMEIPQTDLSPLQEQLTSLELRVADLGDRIEASRKEEYEALNSELGSLTSSFTAFSVPDFDPVEKRLSGVEQAVASIQFPETDLSPLHVRLDRLEQRLGEQDIDFSPLHLRLDRLEQHLSEQGVDFSPLYLRLDRLEQQVSEPDNEYSTLFARLAGMEAAIDALDRGPIDFTPVQGRIAALENSIAALRNDVHGIPDLAPVERQLASLQQAILAIPQTDLTPVVSSMRSIDSRLDMAAMENRLTAIEYGLTAVHHMLRSRQDAPAPISRIEPELYAQAPAKPRRHVTETITSVPATSAAQSIRTSTTYRTGEDPLAAARRPDDQANLLREAAFGEPDDLERISGVGPMLSDLLKDVGVYYFWQIAEWDADDIVWVDDKLQHFKGRIDRDNWVGQAREFAAEPLTANRPG